MQISKKKIILCFVSLILFVLLNLILSFILMPSVGSADKMWREYRKQDNLDMIITGTSLCYSCLDSDVIEKEIGIKSYNMATKAQELNNSYDAIEAAIKDHNIKTAVLTFSYLNLVEYMNIRAETTFFRGKISGLSVGEKMKEMAAFSFGKRHFSSPESINILFPWVFTHVKFRPKTIYNNVMEKLGKRKTSYNSLYEETNKPSKSIINYNKIGNENSKTTYVGIKFNNGQVSSSAFEELRNIISLCKKNNVDLILVNPPKPAFDVLCYGDEYYELYNLINDFACEQNVEYYDFSLAKPELFENSENYYKDFEHMNYFGQQAFSKSFAKFITYRNKGLNLNEMFYSQKEFEESINTISCIYFDYKTSSQKGIELELNAYTGSNINVLYQVLIRLPENSEYTIIQEYSKNDKLNYLPPKHGNYLVRVNAKSDKSQNDFDRFYEEKIYY